MDNYIFYADRIVSVADPYVDDRFVAGHHRTINAAEAETLLPKYGAISASNRLLTGLLKAAARVNKSERIDVIDIGVFMGSFSIGAHLCAKENLIPVRVNAYEANPLLISPLIKNFKLYAAEVSLHWSAIGSKRGSQEIVVPEGGAIGGSLVETKKGKEGNYFSCPVDVLPLSDILPDHEQVGIVKIDIEGYEVPAFSGIATDQNKLHNIFIVEYAPHQRAQMVAPGLAYNDFIMSNFSVFNIGNWAWFASARPIMNDGELANCDLGNGGHNTDLLLIPKSLHIDPLLF